MKGPKTALTVCITAGLTAIVAGALPRPPMHVVAQEVAGDLRTEVVVPARAREDNRDMLAALNRVLVALDRGDEVSIAEAARSGGMAIAVDADPAVAARVPQAFARLGMSTHLAFDALAEAVEAGASRDSVVAHLGRLTGNCVACHETYRLGVEQIGGR